MYSVNYLMLVEKLLLEGLTKFKLNLNFSEKILALNEIFMFMYFFL